MDLEKICKQVCEITIEAGIFVKDNINEISEKNIDKKGVHDFVTYVDKTTEKFLVDKLRPLVSGAGFIVEEKTVDIIGEKYNWVIDPLDGTTNYIHGLAPYAVSVALMQKNEILIGVVYEIDKEECFYTWKDGASYLNGKEIKVSDITSVNNSLIATGFPYYDYKRIKPFLSTLEYFMNNSHGIRRLGSAATDLAYVACGRFEGFYEYSLSPWDVAAGALIVKNAGGKLCDFSGGEDFVFGKEMIASNKEIFDEFSEIIGRMMDSADR